MDAFVLVPNLDAELVIGLHTLNKYHIQLDFKTGSIHLDPNAGRLILM